jgi:hypothetical protein
MWVDYDVPTLKNFYLSPFSKWPPICQAEKYRSWMNVPFLLADENLNGLFLDQQIFGCKFFLLTSSNVSHI